MVTQNHLVTNGGFVLLGKQLLSRGWCSEAQLQLLGQLASEEIQAGVTAACPSHREVQRGG